MFKRIILLTLILFTFKGCTVDDICPEGAATTANLVITFNDIANPNIRKKVEFLSVLTNNTDSIRVIKPVLTDSIVIPLDTKSDATRYLFVRNRKVSETDTIKIYDELIFTYNRENIYVNRACGFKTEFTNLNADFENANPDNWIEEIDIKRQIVNDENSAHITLLH